MSRLLLPTVSLMTFGCTIFSRTVDPIVPQIAAGFDVLPTTAALLVSAYALPYAMVQPILGALADVLGKARLMVVCLAIAVVATFASAAAFTFVQLVVARVLVGAVSGGVFPAAVALVGDRFSMAQRQVAIGRVIAAGMFGNLLGASIAGLAGDLWNWRGAFIITGLFALMTLLLGPALLRETRDEPRAPPKLSTMVANYRAVLSNPLAKVCFGAVFLDSLFVFGLFPYMTVVLRAQDETRATIAGVIIAAFGIGAIIYSMAVRHLLMLTSDRGLMVGGGVIVSLCLLLVPLHPPWPVLAVTFLVMGVAFFMLHGSIQVYATELAPVARGSAMALHSTSFFLGMATGPLFFGFGFTHLGMALTFVLAAIGMVAVGIGAAVGLREPRGGRQQAPPTAG
jgi:predicted MFS family arabinose efflux permease